MMQEEPVPELKDDEVLIDVVATVVNEVDVQARNIFSPKFPNKILYQGLEFSGIIKKIGKNVKKFNVNDMVCAAFCGGYVRQVVLPEDQVLQKPKNITLFKAASLPYAACTIWSHMFSKVHLSDNKPRISEAETLLVHEDSSGLGLFALLLAKHFKKVETCTTYRSKKYMECCCDQNFDQCIDYKYFTEFKKKVLPTGVDVILDTCGPKDFLSHISVLKPGGRLICIHDCYPNDKDYTCSIPKVLDNTIPKRLAFADVAFFALSDEMKSSIVEEVRTEVWRAIEDGLNLCFVYSEIFPFSRMEDAFNIMKMEGHFGKIILVPDEQLAAAKEVDEGIRRESDGRVFFKLDSIE